MNTGAVCAERAVPTGRGPGWVVFWFAAVLTLLTHGAYWLLDHEHYAVDTASYLIPADNLVRGLGFVNEAHEPELRRTPGYPLVLALFRMEPLRVDYLIVAQHLLCVAMAALAAVIGWRISGSKVVALVAAAVLALDLATVRIANLLMTEVAAMVLVALTAWCVYRGLTRETGRTWWMMAAGLLGGCGALVRPVGSLYFVALAICLLAGLKRRAFRPIVILCASFLLLPVLWACRNYLEAGYFGISTIGAEDILYYRAAGALALQQPGSYLENAKKIKDVLTEQTCGDLERAYGRDCSTIGEPQKAAYETHMGAAIILRSPVSYVRSMGLSLAYIVFGGGAEALSRVSDVRPRTAEHIVLLITVPEALLAIAGCWYWYRRDRKLFYVLVLTVGYFFVLSAGAEAYSRFRVPVMPMYALLIGGGAEWMGRKIQRAAAFPVDTRQ